MNIDDYTQPIEAVIAQEEREPKEYRELRAFQEFYGENGALLAAHNEAAKVFEKYGMKVSANTLTSFVRYLNAIGIEGVMEVAQAYRGVDWKRDDPYAISNDTNPGLGLWLRDRGRDVALRNKELNKLWEETYGVGER